MLRRRHSQMKESVLPSSLAPIIKLWMLRILVTLGGQKEFVQINGFEDDSIALALGLGKWIDADYQEFDRRAVRKELRKLHAEAERSCANIDVTTHLRQNTERLKKLVGLTECDCRILKFVSLVHHDQLLGDTADCLGALNSVKLIHVFSVLLDQTIKDVRTSLDQQGILVRSGLLSIDRCASLHLHLKLSLLSDQFADCMINSKADPTLLLKSAVFLSSPPKLKLRDFEHINKYLFVLHPYLANALKTKRRGVNIILHGCPGTGKTELSRVLANELGCELFEISSEDDAGDAISGNQRLRAYRAGQSFFALRQVILLFDEVEDVFDDGASILGKKSTAQTHKAWINRSLEENPVPTIWLTNSIHSLDAAFLRRFDMVFELPIPPEKQRQRILQEACGDMMDMQNLARFAESENLAPAVVTRAASVVRSIRNELGGDVTPALALLFNCTLEAQRHQVVKIYDPKRLPELYDLRYINSDVNLSTIAEGLVNFKQGRLCLYGPPGTGKTAYARWLAEQIGMPLMTKSASDILSKWVGDLERNLARAFKEAERDGAVLLIDEVDSFLQDRRGASHNWEVTGVNEMLTQMEAFSGIFIASTNLMSGLDQAALRRFDLKLKFDYLLPQQSSDLFMAYCTQLGFVAPESKDLERIRNLRNLTPGDFTTVHRQHRFYPIKTSLAFVDALIAHCGIKEDNKSTIGFIN